MREHYWLLLGRGQRTSSLLSPTDTTELEGGENGNSVTRFHGVEVIEDHFLFGPTEITRWERNRTAADFPLLLV